MYSNWRVGIPLVQFVTSSWLLLILQAEYRRWIKYGNYLKFVNVKVWMVKALGSRARTLFYNAVYLLPRVRA